jgi:hypothetical protein
MGRLRGTPTHDAAPCWLTVDKLGGEKAQYVERVLDVRQGELCWVVGTVYMDLSLKPNVLADISKEVRLPPMHPLADRVRLPTRHSTGSLRPPPAPRTCRPKRTTKTT